jgi:hypothetical protein
MIPYISRPLSPRDREQLSNIQIASFDHFAYVSARVAHKALKIFDIGTWLWR